MYNEDQKNSYIESLGKDESDNQVMNIITYFNSTADIETALDKDVSCFNINEIIGYYKSLGTSSSQYLAVINSKLGDYTDWCLSGGLVPNHQNEFNNIKRSNLEECINKHLFHKEIVSREELLELINKYQFNPGDNFLLLALFEGICGSKYEEIINLRMKDIDGTTVSLHSIPNRTLNVSKKLVELANESSKVFTYMTSDGKERKFNDDGDNVYKFPENTNTEKKKEFFIIRHLKLMRGDDSERCFIGSKELKESGRIEMIKEFMRENGWSAEEALRNKKKEIEFRYGRIMSIPIYLRNYEEVLRLPV